MKFKTPENEEEAIEKIEELKEEAQDIQVQLTNKNKKRRGKRMTSDEYRQWRQKAIHALNCKKNEIMFLKKFVNGEIREEDKAVLLLRDAYKMIKDVFDGFGEDEITDEEKEKIEEIRKFIKK
jgi:hypothetical protein